MSGMEGASPTDVSVLSTLEDRIAATLAKTTGEISRTESLDIEQRSEIYAILETLKADTEAHRALVDMLKRKLIRKTGDA
jgi:hypothetical protein